MNFEDAIKEHPEKVAEAIRAIALSIGGGASDAVLVGGQAVLFWANEMGIPVPPGIPLVTRDVDFIASIPDIMDAESAISKIYNSSLVIAGMDDASPNSGTLVVDYPGACKINVDFLRTVTGLGTGEIRESSFPMKIKGQNGGEIVMRVISPIDLLISKVSNLGAHPNKRNAEGIAQAKLTVEIVKRYLEEKIVEANKAAQKAPYRQFEQVVNLAMDDPALFAHRNFGIDVLRAIPLEALDLADPFIVKRLPVVERQVAVKREKFDNMIMRMESFGHNEMSARFHPS